ncbi:MAG TPA: hypothetical protein EYP36_01255 [Calditrichaeota bacterium]|nr:hypothetical protein [Calditrichota bacterium]
MKYLTIISFIFILLFSCSPTDSDIGDPLERVRMVLRTVDSDTAQWERGTDAYPSETNDIQIMWYSHPGGKELKKFKIYRSEVPDGSRKYNKIAEINIVNDQNQDTLFIDTGLELQKSYYYYVVAENQDGLSSDPSDTVWYALIEKPQLIAPRDGARITTDSITFEWTFPGYEPNYYILRIEKYWDESYHPVVSVSMIQSKYEGQMQVILSEKWISDAVSSEIYRWRVDAVGSNPLHEGSESGWYRFTIDN